MSGLGVGRALLGVLGLALLAGALMWAAGALRVPPAYLPWAPLDLSDRPNLLTGLKLARVKSDPHLCRRVLATSRLQTTPVPDRDGGPGCAIRNAVRIARSGPLTYNAPFLAGCPLAVAWALFEDYAVQPAARRAFGQDVSRINHFGTYACRNVNHAEAGRRSEHATANAIDVAGFVLRDGREITLTRGWSGPGDPRAATFLRDVREGACRFFSVVLGPDYNAAHRDHFHLDMGRFRACR